MNHSPANSRDNAQLQQDEYCDLYGEYCYIPAFAISASISTDECCDLYSEYCYICNGDSAVSMRKRADKKQ